MSDQTPLKLQLPLRKSDGTVYSAEELLKAIADHRSGHYLLGDYNYWHGGVHLADDKFKDACVTAIADGTIVAYRINEKYEEMDLNTRPPLAMLKGINNLLVGTVLSAKGVPVPVPGADISSATNAVTSASNLATGVTDNNATTGLLPIVPPPTQQTPTPLATDAGGAAGEDTASSDVSATDPLIGAGERAIQDVANMATTEEGKKETEKEDPDRFKFKYSTSFCLIKHEYKSSDAPIKMLPPAANSKKILRVNNASGLSRWADQENATKLSGKFLPNSLFEVVSEVKNKASLFMAEGYPLDSNGVREQSGGTDLLCWMNTGKTTQYQHVSLVESKPLTDWQNPDSITVEVDDIGYSYNPSAQPESAVDCKKITIPSGTTLKLVKPVKTCVANQLTYYQVQADKVLQTSYKASDAANAADLTGTHNAGDTFWYPITRQDGETRTAKNADNKDVPVAKPDPKSNELTFYSLYMHLLPYQEYEVTNPHANKNFVITIQSFVDERSSPDDGAKAVVNAAVGKDRIYEVVGQKKNGDFNFLNVYQVDEHGKRNGTKDYWIKEGGNNSKKKYIAYTKPYTIASTTPKKRPMHWVDGQDVVCEVTSTIDVLKKAADNSVAKIGELAAKNTFTYAYPRGLDTPKAKFIECKLTSGQVADSKGVVLLKAGDVFYIEEKSLDNVKQEIKPQKFDEVVTCSIPVKAGEMLGYLGLYESPIYPATETEKMEDTPALPPNASPEQKLMARTANNAKIEAKKNAAKPPQGLRKCARHQLHFEIFSNDELRINGFLDNQAQLNTGKKYLKVNKGAQLVIGESFDAPSTAITGLNTHYFTAANTPTLKRDWYWEMSQVSVVKDAKGVEWYKLIVKNAGDKNFGWIKKQDQNEELSQYDLRKLGFTVITENNPGATGDVFVNASEVTAAGNANTLEKFFEDIVKEVDSQDTTKVGENAAQEKGKLSLAEIHAAYADTDGLALTLQKIIAKYPSEWRTQLEVEKVVANRIKLHVQANGTPQQKAKVEEFKEEEDRLQLLDAFLSAHKLVFFEWEQERIGKLTFLDSVPALAATPSVYHFHPVVFIDRLKTGIPLIWMKRVLEVHGNEHGELFRDKIIETCERLKIDPNNLLACMALETGRRFRANTRAPNSSATGLIQFMRSTAIRLGTTVEKLELMNEIEQMSYVEKYFIQVSKDVKIPTSQWSLGDLYHAIFTPATIKLSPNDTVYSKGDAGYESNKGHDVNKDGIITKSEIEHNINLFYKEGLKYIA